MAKIKKVELIEFVFELSQEDMETLKTICKEWEEGDTSTGALQGEVVIGAPTMLQKRELARYIQREGATLRG